MKQKYSESAKRAQARKDAQNLLTFAASKLPVLKRGPARAKPAWERPARTCPAICMGDRPLWQMNCYIAEFATSHERTPRHVRYLTAVHNCSICVALKSRLAISGLHWPWSRISRTSIMPTGSWLRTCSISSAPAVIYTPISYSCRSW